MKQTKKVDAALIVIGSFSLLLVPYIWIELPPSYITGLLAAMFGGLGFYCLARYKE